MIDRDGSTNSTTRLLLGLGALAGPVYLLVGLLQILIRPGFDVTRHPLSMLANGELGWVQVANFLVTALLVMAGAVGLMRLEWGGLRAGAVLIFIYGLSMVGAALFKADPGAGFPPGAPDVVTEISFDGIMHFAMGGVGFLALIAGAITRAVVHFRKGQAGPGWFALVTGVFFLAAFVGIASGAGNPVTVLGFYAAVILAFVWLTAVFLGARRA